MERKPDIFDKIMAWKIMKPFRKFYYKYREVLLYLFFGAVTCAVGIGSFYIFANPLGVHELVSNIISWALAVSVAYLCDRTWVFKYKEPGVRGFLRQMGKFAGGRLFSLGLEELIIYVFVTRLCFPNMAVKIAEQIVIITVNYLISKFIVFRKNKYTE